MRGCGGEQWGGGGWDGVGAACKPATACAALTCTGPPARGGKRAPRCWLSSATSKHVTRGGWGGGGVRGGARAQKVEKRGRVQSMGQRGSSRCCVNVGSGPEQSRGAGEGRGGRGARSQGGGTREWGRGRQLERDKQRWWYWRAGMAECKSGQWQLCKVAHRGRQRGSSETSSNRGATLQAQNTHLAGAATCARSWKWCGCQAASRAPRVCSPAPLRVQCF